MKWNQVSKYALVSECGAYSVAKIGLGSRFIYEAWRTKSHPSGRSRLQGFPMPEQAKARCEADEQG